MGGGKSSAPAPAPQPAFKATPITDGSPTTRTTNVAALERTKANANPSLLTSPDEDNLRQQKALLG